MSEVNDFKDLKIWQQGMNIAKQCYFLTKHEAVGLCDKKDIDFLIQELQSETRMIIALMRKLE